MDKLDKPKFFKSNSFIDIIGIVGFIIGLIQFIIPDNILPLRYKIYILAIIFFLFLIIYIIQYIINWHKMYKDYLKFYKDYEELTKKHLAIAEQFDKKSMTIKKQEKLILAYKYMLLKISDDISNGILCVSDFEKKYLEHLYNVILKDIEHLYKLEGDI